MKTNPRRYMRLTRELVARVPAFVGASGSVLDELVKTTDADHADTIAGVLRSRAPGSDVWIFAYGSLIWNPVFIAVEERIARAPGWRRSFCLGWNTIFRGSVGRPGVMLALDRGGSCTGVAYRLPRGEVQEVLLALLRREMPFKPSPFPARWLKLQTASGRLEAIGFAIDRNSERYLGGLSLDATAAALATAAGERGSMADYLWSTISNLEARGIHDDYLWQLQDRVAGRLMAEVVGGPVDPH